MASTVGVRNIILSITLAFGSTSKQLTAADKLDFPETRLEGEVSAIELLENTETRVSIEVRLKMRLTNLGKTPLIVLKTQRVCVRELVGRSTDPLAGILYESQHLPAAQVSSRNHPLWTLASSLNVGSPPKDLTIVLPSGSADEFQMRVALNLAKHGESVRQASWKNVTIASPTWLFVRVEFWPKNLELVSRKPRLGKSLRSRWRQSGTLLLDSVDSSAISIDLRSLRL